MKKIFKMIFNPDGKNMIPEEQDSIDYLILNGGIEVVGLDSDNGEFLYAFTPKIKELMPHCCIGVDVIVGYPGEEHADFIDTYNYLNELNISYLHVFTYSERVNTTAYKLPGKVNLSERADRSKMLHILSDKKRLAYYNEHIGNTYPVLWEAENDHDVMYGFTSNYIKVKTKYDPMLVNEIIEVEITAIDTDDMVAKCKLLQMVF